VASLEAQLSTYNILVPRSLGEVGSLITNNSSTSAQLGLTDFSTNNATLSGTLNVAGRTLLADVGITGKVNVGLLSINGLDSNCSVIASKSAAISSDSCATINTTSGPLKLQSDGFNGLDILNGKVVIEANGNMKINGEITVKKVNVDTQDVAAASLGEGIVKTNDSQTVISTESVTDKSKIFVTFSDDYSPAARYWIADKTNGKSFILKLDKPMQNDTKFNWWIIN
jgi:hypothetical protein